MISLFTLWGHTTNAAIFKPGWGPLLGTESANTLTLDLPTSWTVKNKPLLNHSVYVLFFFFNLVYGIFYSSLNWQKNEFKFLFMLLD